MIYYDRINVSKGIDVDKTKELKQCDICCYWYLLNVGFKLQSHLCNRFHDLVIMSMSFSNIAILKLKVLIIALLLAELAKVISQS